MEISVKAFHVERNINLVLIGKCNDVDLCLHFHASSSSSLISACNLLLCSLNARRAVISKFHLLNSKEYEIYPLSVLIGIYKCVSKGFLHSYFIKQYGEPSNADIFVC